MMKMLRQQGCKRTALTNTLHHSPHYNARERTMMTNQERADRINEALPVLHAYLLYALYFALDGTGVDASRVFSLVSDKALSGKDKLLACELAFEREPEIFGKIKSKLSRALLEKDLDV